MKHQKFIFYFILAVLFFPIKTIAQQNIKALFEYSNGKIFLHYTFVGNPDLKYKVSMKLKKKSDPSFEYIPKDISGNIGTGYFANQQDEITWTLSENDKESFKGDDYYFQLFADEIKNESSGGVAWYVYVGGALLGGGAAAILLINKGNSTASATTNSFPQPPSRP